MEPFPKILSRKVGVCVIAGNVRRTAEIAFGDPGNEEYIHLKNYEKNPDRVGFGWASNNSVLAELGMDYAKVFVSNETAEVVGYSSRAVELVQ